MTPAVYTLIYLISVAILVAFFWWVLVNDNSHITRGDLFWLACVCLSGPIALIVLVMAFVFVGVLYVLLVLENTVRPRIPLPTFDGARRWFDKDVRTPGRKDKGDDD